jgi:hypothetical protein
MRLYVNGAPRSRLSLATFLSGSEINTLECRRESHLLNSATMFDLFCLWFGAVLRIVHNRQNLLLENLAFDSSLWC